MSSRQVSRRGWVALCLGAAVLTFAVLLTVAPAGAHKKSGRRIAHGGGGGGFAWRVMRPISYKNLTLFPVRARDAGSTDAYITLDEGIKRGVVVISEKGGGQIVRRVRGRNGRMRVVRIAADGDSAEVNKLVLTNRSGKKLLLLAGEVVVGGNQDRIVEEDLIVPPVSVPVSLDVFCVEHGRWQERAGNSSGSAPVAAPVNSPDITIVQRSEITVVQNSDARQTSSSASRFTSLGAIAHPKLRANAQDKKEQGAVWEEVAKNNVALKTENSTGTYQEVYASKDVETGMKEYMSALQKEMPMDGVVGVVVARGGELVWVDAFASSTLFARYWPKLLKSYVIDAMSEQPVNKQPSVEQAQAYLQERAGKTTFEGRQGVYQLVKTENPKYAVFELQDVSLPAPFRLHFNKMQR